MRISLLERMLFWVCGAGTLTGLIIAGIGVFHEDAYGRNDLTHLVSPGLLIGMGFCGFAFLHTLLLIIRSKHT